MKPTLLILAAGMGSRYGGLKQIDGIGPDGETILDYSVFDAIRAGFGKVVFVIRRDFEEGFRDAVVDRVSSRIDTDLVFQEMDTLPQGVPFRPQREKPWGTGHALWCARFKVREPFVVLNADDFYGAESFSIASDFLARDLADTYGLVGFPLEKTLSDHGPVSRGVCEVNSEGHLREIVERLSVFMTDRGPAYLDESGKEITIPSDRVASMNMWALHPSVFDLFEGELLRFFESIDSNPKQEFLIPTVLNHAVATGDVQISVLPTPSEWFGLTYAADRLEATKRVRNLIELGAYPERLWT